MTTDYAARLKHLRTGLTAAGVAGFLVPMADAYQSEYVPASDRRIEFLSGFTGSAGFIAVLQDQAAFFTDGRYTLQAQQQVPAELFEVFDSAVKTPTAWLTDNLGKGARLGFDPWLHTEDSVERLRQVLAKKEIKLIPLAQNPVDAIWPDRPAPPAEPIYAHDLAYAGKTSAAKRAEIGAELQKAKLAASIVTDPAAIAWLLNIRGSDVPNTPLPLSFAILFASSKVKWFVDPAKLPPDLSTQLGDTIEILHRDQFPHALDRLALEAQPVRIDLGEAASWIVARLRAAKVKLEPGADPCALPKAIKNSVELEGMRAAHRRDGAALTSFLCWLDYHWLTGAVTELDAEAKLAEFRSAANLYRGPSFDTIAGCGAHGAIIHYRATRVTNRRLEAGQLFLLDSGGQYLDGTTDVTRTVMLGTPTPEMRDRFTRVLQGHIALAAVRFPAGTSGGELDALARRALWDIGGDYNHGTGHGVGSFLGVHEGPQGISKRNTVPLRPGMVVSNEPGYYKPGAYGIRIENLQAVVELAGASMERSMLGFEPLTLAPIDRKLIEPALLSDAETRWLNAYHARVFETLRPLIDGITASWLADVTRPL